MSEYLFFIKRPEALYNIKEIRSLSILTTFNNSKKYLSISPAFPLHPTPLYRINTFKMDRKMKNGLYYIVPILIPWRKNYVLYNS